SCGERRRQDGVLRKDRPMADQRTTNSDGRASALAYLAVLIFAWGGNYTWMKMALADIGPWAMNFARYALGIGLIATALIFAGRTRELIPVRGERIELACIGFLQAAVIT